MKVLMEIEALKLGSVIINVLIMAYSSVEETKAWPG